MQAVEVLKASPMASVKRACADQVEGCGDDVVAVLGQHQQETLAHRLADGLEEGQREGRDPAALVEGVAIEPMEGGPFRLRDRVARDASNPYAGFDDAAPLAFDLFALFGRKGPEIFVERAVAPVVPVKLTADASEQALILEECLLVVRREEPMHRGDSRLLGHPDRALNQCACVLSARGRIPGQETRSRGGGVGRGDHQFRIVLKPFAPVGVRPAPVEDELPV